MIGDILKEQRKNLGIDLREVSKALKIRYEYLLAIENSEFDKIPGEVFTRGYIRAYAIYLKIDPEPLIEEFNNLYSKDENPLKEIKPEIIGKDIKKGKRTVQYITATVIFLILILIFKIIDRNHREPVVLKDKESPLSLKPQEEKEETPLLEKTTVEKTPPSPQDNEYTVKFIASELSWILLETDNIKKDFTLKPGESFEQKVKDKTRIVLGNAGGVKVIVNGVEKELKAKSGEVKIINLP